MESPELERALARLAALAGAARSRAEALQRSVSQLIGAFHAAAPGGEERMEQVAGAPGVAAQDATPATGHAQGEVAVK